MPYLQWRCIVEIEFRGGKGTCGSVHGQLFCLSQWRHPASRSCGWQGAQGVQVTHTGIEHAGERGGSTGRGGGSAHAQRGCAGSAGRRPRLGAGGSAVLVGDGVRRDTGKGAAQAACRGWATACLVVALGGAGTRGGRHAIGARRRLCRDERRRRMRGVAGARATALHRKKIASRRSCCGLRVLARPL
jgi:hypothetical protein